MRASLTVAWLGLLLLAGLFPARPETSTAPIPIPPVDFNHLPWPDGESLTYLISLSGFEAAQGTFVARKKDAGWEFKLTLASRGLIDDVYPFTGYFWSILPAPPWRSVEYGEYRFEPHRMIKERTLIDYAAHKATRAIWSEAKTKTFAISVDSIDDIGSMLYHLRARAWKPGDKETLFVYENNSEKQGLIECQERETRAFGSWPAQPLLRISALPGKGTRRKGHLVFWLTDDARHLPLHADLDFLYGTFSIDLIKAEKTLPASPHPGYP
jgi:hypothetical protein